MYLQAGPWCCDQDCSLCIVSRPEADRLHRMGSGSTCSRSHTCQQGPAPPDAPQNRLEVRACGRSRFSQQGWQLCCQEGRPRL